MKKFLVLFTAFLVSCGEASKQEQKEQQILEDTVPVESSAYLDMGIDTVFVDSTQIKISMLLSSTEKAETKVKEIKAIKKENVALKKELVETKAELEQVKAVLEDTLNDSAKTKKKKGFIQKVISTIKKDSI